MTVITLYLKNSIAIIFIFYLTNNNYLFAYNYMFQVFLSNTNNLYTIIWFQETIPI